MKSLIANAFASIKLILLTQFASYIQGPRNQVSLKNRGFDAKETKGDLKNRAFDSEKSTQKPG
ncbi:hypothetical protein [Microseira wollei]|uniref:hypothetical protein n=1 Tax=Microseira wollei TaxID=467598 RepID=UPI001CFD36E0|nr:hypothetical protein [Microseira wollei]